MGILQDDFDRVIQELYTDRPLMALVFRRVGRQKGIELKDSDIERLVEAFSTHEGPENSFSVDLEIESPLEITPDDVEAALTELGADMEEGIQKGIMGALQQTSPSILESLYLDAPEALKDRQARQDRFEERLKTRWGEGLDRLEMLIMIAQEAGGTFVEDMRNGEDEHVQVQAELLDALIRLHARACRFASEVICLMKGGFADGANARWRSLHELAVTGIFLQEHPESAEGYLDHAAVERLRDAEEYQRHCKVLGFEPFTDEELEELKQDLAAVLTKYGKEFRKRYGWAAKALNNPDPNFAQIEESLRMDTWRPFYKLACQSVHAGSQGLVFSLATPRNADLPLIAGASDAGLCDPGQQTAISLTLATVTLLTSVPNLDRLVTCRCMDLLSEDIKASLFEAHDSLEQAVQRRSEEADDSPEAVGRESEGSV